MDATKTSFLVGVLVFLCLSLGSANRVLKDHNVENESISNTLSSGKDDHLHNFREAELNSKTPKGSIPEFSSIGPLNGECCNHGSNCGGYVCPPSYNCGGSSGCQPHFSCSQCPWQGCQGCQLGPPSGCQGCQPGPPSGCQGCQPGPPSGCQGCQLGPPPCGYEVVNENISKVQETINPVGEPYPPIIAVTEVQAAGNDNIKSSGGANQDNKSNGGLV